MTLLHHLGVAYFSATVHPPYPLQCISFGIYVRLDNDSDYPSRYGPQTVDIVSISFHVKVSMLKINGNGGDRHSRLFFLYILDGI